MKAKEKKEGYISQTTNVSLTGIFTALVTVIVLITSIVTVLIFIEIYKNAMEQSAVTSGEQAVVQVKNTVADYTGDMSAVMDMIQKNMKSNKQVSDEFIQNLVEVRPDVVAITAYEEDGTLIDYWSDGRELKQEYSKNLSYMKLEEGDTRLNITKPHVMSLFVNYYPWVVTISQRMQDAAGHAVQISMDIRFSNIANYVDDVGIGQHGYCYIADKNGNIIYHPQQQLLYSGLKEEDTENLKDGSYTKENVIYTVHTLPDTGWRIVGVCYVDEMITSKVENMVGLLIVILVVVLAATLLVGWILSRLFSRPAKNLTKAMREFEQDAEHFVFSEVTGTSEVMAISNSFGHLVVRIQELMEQVRQEEITLRKTELNALQAQINPHFLYNTLDAIAWMCEDKRNEDAEEMVNALARLFRISISKGHELIPIKREVEHAESYLKIVKFRYKNQFIYSFDVEESCLPYLCNKITLQPIIENAIYHGLSRMVDEGVIAIRIYEDDEDIILSVEDNGVGMTPEQCGEILLKDSGDRTGIGIKNVNDRIKIYFGSQYGLTITSELDEGTRVDIRMPKVREGEQNAKQQE